MGCGGGVRGKNEKTVDTPVPSTRVIIWTEYTPSERTLFENRTVLDVRIIRYIYTRTRTVHSVKAIEISRNKSERFSCFRYSRSRVSVFIARGNLRSSIKYRFTTIYTHKREDARARDCRRMIMNSMCACCRYLVRCLFRVYSFRIHTVFI